MRVALEFTIPRALPSWNPLAARSHWTKRATEATRWWALTRQALGRERPVLRFPVVIHVTVGRPNPQDADNIPAKLVIDGLKGAVLPDDDLRYVARVCTTPRRSENPYTLVRVLEKEEER